MQYQVFNRAVEPSWRPVTGVLRRGLPPDLRSWLIDTASLTERLQRLYGRAFRVRVRGQRWLRPAFSERVALGMADHRTALVREVHLLRGAMPVVFARTVMPAEALCGSGRRLARLGNRPLGAMLFADHRIARLGLEIAQVDPRHALYTAATGRADGRAIWGRRSVFVVGNQPILVNELFLPALLSGTAD